jgi:hypothetical protein
VQKLLSKTGNTNTHIISGLTKDYYFYCAECESRTKVMFYFRTYCQCKESSCIATVYEVEYNGCAVDEQQWEQMLEASNETRTYPTSSKFM